MRTIATIAFLCVLGGIAGAQTERAAPSTPKSFWVACGALAGGVAADAASTHGYLQRGYVEVDSPLLYGRRPSMVRFVAVSAALEGGAAYLGYRMVRSDKKAWRVAGWTLLSWRIGTRWGAAGQNWSLR